MRCAKSNSWCFFLSTLLLLSSHMSVQAADEAVVSLGERPSLRAGALAADFKFDGSMNGIDARMNGHNGKSNGLSWWDAADSITNLVTIEPEEGGVPAGQTIIKVLANQQEIMVVARCYDHDPNGIVSFTKARDSELDEEDHIVIVLDTFRDGRSGYVFAVNPTGARFDGLVIEQGEDVNSDWDTIWEANTLQDDAGWYAEIRIPIKSLNFRKDLTEWGFNVERRVQRLQETSRWSSAKRDYEIEQTSRAGLLTNLPNFDLGRGLSVRPAFRARRANRSPGQRANMKAT